MEITPNVAVLTVTYGTRWHFLSQVVGEVMKDAHVSKLIIVDNGSQNNKEIIEGARIYGDRITILRLEKNIGSAGGFAKGIEYVRGIDCEYVLMLDDDNLPEERTIDKFIEQRKKLAGDRIVLVGNRVNIPGNENIFYGDEKSEILPKGSFFQGLSFKKIRNFLSLFSKQKPSLKNPGTVLQECIPNESFVYGGAFIPIEAIREAPLPDKNLILYGDDIEYSWGIKRLGYESYVCQSPKIYDIDMSFGEGSQAVGLMAPETPLFRIYYRIRNMVLISRRNTKQSKVALFVNIFIWLVGLFILGLARYGMKADFFKKVWFILGAVWAGYFPESQVPKEAALS
jgi:GT2 family glycosyltransferase